MDHNVLKRANISEEDCQSLEEALKRYNDISQQPHNIKPYVVCTGIYNAGKSTLLNALIETERFPTGDIPYPLLTVILF